MEEGISQGGMAVGEFIMEKLLENAPQCRNWNHGTHPENADVEA